MGCDRCFTRSDVRPLQHDFPLIEFADKGWLISNRADVCPACVAKGERPIDPVYSRERLEDLLEFDRVHCRKYYKREPQSPYVTALLARAS